VRRGGRVGADLSWSLLLLLMLLVVAGLVGPKFNSLSSSHSSKTVEIKSKYGVGGMRLEGEW